jgi:type IV pilus assembly protein PilA
MLYLLYGDYMKKNRGFTLVELLAVIVILAVILVIAIPNVMKVIDNAKLDTYSKNESLMVNATRNYLTSNADKAPINIGDIVSIDLSELQSNNIIGNIKDVKSSSSCTGKVIIVKKSLSEYVYNPYLDCGSSYKTYGNYASNGLILNLDGYSIPSSNAWPDTSGSGNNANMMNMSNNSVSGYDANKRAYVFDGVNDYLQLLSAVSLGDNTTIEIVYNINSVSSDPTKHIQLLGSSNGASSNLISICNTTCTNVRQRVNGYSVFHSDINGGLGLNYLAFKRTNISGSGSHYYKNGLFKSSQNNATWTPAMINTYQYVGSIDPTYSFVGYIYAIRVYNRVLTDIEIQTNYSIDKQRFGL